MVRAIRDACANILKNPAYFTTWLGSNRPIFEGGSARLTIKNEPARLDKATLSNWWEQAILGSVREEQFFSEAEAALPLLGQNRTVEGVFEGMLQQRLRLKTNLQLAEWLGV